MIIIVFLDLSRACDKLEAYVTLFGAQISCLSSWQHIENAEQGVILTRHNFTAMCATLF